MCRGAVWVSRHSVSWSRASPIRRSTSAVQTWCVCVYVFAHYRPTSHRRRHLGLPACSLWTHHAPLMVFILPVNCPQLPRPSPVHFRPSPSSCRRVQRVNLSARVWLCGRMLFANTATCLIQLNSQCRVQWPFGPRLFMACFFFGLMNVKCSRFRPMTSFATHATTQIVIRPDPPGTLTWRTRVALFRQTTRAGFSVEIFIDHRG